MNYTEHYAPYYDLLYAEKDYEQEAIYVDTLIRKYNNNKQNILEFGCGTGRHAVTLAQKGYNIHGIDMSKSMIKIAQERTALTPYHQQLFFEHADIRTARLQKTYDTVISLFHVMGYQITDHDLIAAFTTAHAHLPSNGIFIFDCWYGPAILYQGSQIKIKRTENEMYMITRISEPTCSVDENKINIQYTLFIHNKKTGNIQKSEETHPMRYVFKPEIESLLNRTGFSLVSCEEWLTGKQPTMTSWNICFICKKL